MALANFFDRAAMAASQVLAGFDQAAFSAKLDRHVIGIAVDGNAAGTSEGRATLDMCVRLVSRLYPRISLLPQGSGAAPAAEEAIALARSINPAIDVEGPEETTVCIAIGTTTPQVGCPTIFVGSNGWTARLSQSAPVGSGGSDLPFGAGAAACFAVANVFRLVFRDQLPGGALDQDLALSLLTFARPGEVEPKVPEVVDMGRSHLVGVGAIGNGAVWALSRHKGLTGTLHLVDGEEVDLPNLQRYVLAGQSDVGSSKSDRAAALFLTPGLSVVPHRCKWAEYVAERGDWHFDAVAVALDTGADRITMQAALPRWIVNAWTQDIDLGVSRHRFGDGRACLACLYMPTGEVKSEHERLADELQMSESAQEIKRMLQVSTPLDAGFIHRVGAAMSIPAEELMQFVGRPLREFHQAAICGGLAFTLTGGAQAVRAVVPMSFQSAMAGIMLAAELVKHAAGLPDPIANTTRINLLRPLGSMLHDPIAPDRSGRCICADPDFKAVYEWKYSPSMRASG